MSNKVTQLSSGLERIGTQAVGLYLVPCKSSEGLTIVIGGGGEPVALPGWGHVF